MTLTQQLNRLKANIQALEGDHTDLLALLNPAIDTAAPYDGLDATAAREALAAMPDYDETKKALTRAATERDNFQSQFTEQSKANGQLQRQLVATRGLFEIGVLPEYEKLMQPAVMDMLVDGDDGPALPENFAATLREKYPATIAPTHDAAGSGSGGGNGTGGDGTQQPTVVTRSTSGVITGVNPQDVLNGTAVLAPTA